MKALIIVDVQNDFLPGGALEVKDGDQVVPVINQLTDQFDLVVATRDYHPADHRSFASNHEGRKVGEVIDLNGLEQILWPDHCVEGSYGSEFSEDLNLARVDKIFKKGTNPEIDSYSGFFDNGHRQDTGLGDYLKSKDVDTVYIVGLAMDYCVKFTALDAQELGFKTHVIRDATRAVNLQPGDFERSEEELKKAGVHVIS
jgi:nicotinamidase/pyrazinamidase